MNHPGNVLATFEVLQREMGRVPREVGEVFEQVMCARDIQFGHQFPSFSRPFLFLKKLEGRRIESVSAALGPGEGEITIRVELENIA